MQHQSPKHTDPSVNPTCRQVIRSWSQTKVSRFAKGLLVSLVLLVFVVLMMTFPKREVQASPPPTPTRFAVIGDYGQSGQPEADVANLVKSWNPDLIITVGDNNYQLGEAATIDQNVGQYYHEFIGNYVGVYGVGSPTNRFFPTLGDHDWGNAFPRPAGANPYLDYFTLPGNERYYEFVQGPVHFFAIDSDLNEPDGITSDSVQGQWLRTRLAAATEPWKVVYFHQPPFYSGNEPALPQLRWPFKEWGATAVITGHEHNYERLVIDGLPYFVNGLGGNSAVISQFLRPVNGSKAQYLDDYGAMLVDASAETITFKFINRAGLLIDNFSIPTPTNTMHCPEPEPGTNLIARWSAEGDAADFVGNNDGVLTGGVIFGPGQVGQSFQFNGSQADVKVADGSTLLSPFTALSLDAWVYPTAYGADTIPGVGTFGKTIISNTDGDGFALRVLNGYVQADLRLTSGDFLYTFNTGPQSQLPLNEWSHVAMTYDGAVVSAYLNGQMLVAVPATGTIRNVDNATACTCIGNESIGSDCAVQESGFGWRGSIDELEVTSRALSPSEILAIYNAGVASQCYAFEPGLPLPTPLEGECAPAPSGLVAWFPGDDNAFDISGNNNGTLQGGAVFVAGEVANSFSFDGAASNVILPATALHDPFSALSVDAWVYPTSYGSDTIPGVGIYGKTILSITDTDGFALRLKDGFIQADLRLSGGDLLQSFNQTQVPLNAWSHVTITYDGSLVHAYLNGSELGTGVPASGTVRNSLNAGNCAMIGNEPDDCTISNLSGQPAGFGWPGRIDEVQVFNRALTSAEVQSIFNAGSAGACKPVVSTVTTVASSANPSLLGESVTFTANVSGGGSPTGLVQFKANGSPIGGPATLIGGSASVNTSTLAVGSYTITADYSGDSGFLGSTGTMAALQVVNPAMATSTTVTSSPNPSLFGQLVEFTATINVSGTPTGTIQFKLNGLPLGGPVTVVNKTASISTSGVSIGSSTITAVYSGGDGYLGSTGTVTQIVNPNQVSTTSALTVTPNPVQYSDRVNLVATLTPASSNSLVPATSATFKIGTQTMGTAALVPVGGQLQATLANVQLLLSPGSYTATAQFNGVNSNFIVSNATTVFNVMPEDADVTYSGLPFISTSTSTSTTALVTLRATVQDISATPAAAGDTSFGDVRNAKVTFVITNPITSATVATFSNLPVSLVNSSDTKTGTASYNWTANLGSSMWLMYNVHTIVTNYYTRESSEDDALVTISKLGTNYVAGGGYLLESYSAGLLAGSAGSKCSFGFVVRSTTVNGKLVLTGAGGMIVRRGGRVYSFIGSALTSLVSKASTGKATFAGKFIIVDITDRWHPRVVDLNTTFLVTLSDKGTSGTSDTIGVAVWKQDNQLYFSSNWNGATTIEQVLGSGNLLVK